MDLLCAMLTVSFLPFVYRTGNLNIQVFSGLPAFCWVVFSRFEQTDKQAAAYGKYHFKKTFGEDKVGSMFIDKDFWSALILLFFKSRLHSPDILGGIPQNIVLGSDQKELPLYPFDLDLLFFPDRMKSLGLIKHFP